MFFLFILILKKIIIIKKYRKDGKKHGNGSFYYKNDVKYVG